MRETRFEDLRLIQQIGEGGCGKVRTPRRPGRTNASGTQPKAPSPAACGPFNWLLCIHPPPCTTALQVYYGHWNGSPVAIKVVTPHPEHPDKQMQEFQREVSVTVPARLPWAQVFALH